VDRPRAEQAIHDLLVALGESPDREGLHGTPQRVAELFAELYRGVGVDPTSVLNAARPLAEADEQLGDLVALRGIGFSSVCEHHLLPFRGVADVAYSPADRIVGLGILADLVAITAARPQLQERLGDMVAEALVESGVAQGAVVVIRAEHGCVQHRGPQLAASETVTVASAGTLATEVGRREAFLAMGTLGPAVTADEV